MNRFVLAAVLCGLTALAVPAFGQAQQQAAAAATPAPNTFNDPAMSYTAPPGYAMVPEPKYDPTNFSNPTVVAQFVKNPGKVDARMITIVMESYDGSLNGYEVDSENELREQMDGVFVKDKHVTTLSNGMPAYWREISAGEGFSQLNRYEYVWVDGVRGVVLSITGRYGEITKQEAQAALSHASAVAYPRNRYY